MSGLIVLMAVLQVASLVVWLLGKRGQAVWLLAGADVIPFVALGASLVQGSPVSRGDMKLLSISVGALALTLASLWRPLRMAFWLGWLVNLYLVVIFLYLAFFWHPFG